MLGKKTQTIRLSGSGFGLSSYNNLVTRTVRYGPQLKYTATGCTVVQDDVLLQCTSLPGVGSSSSLSVSVQGVSYTSPLLGYQPPCLWNISGPGVDGASTGGGDTVVLTGNNFGPVGALIDFVVYGATVVPGVNPYSAVSSVLLAQGCAVTVPHTQITCTTAPGVGSNLVWTVSIASQVSGLCSSSVTTAAISSHYALPTITSVTVVDSRGAPAGQMQTEGGTQVLVVGTNLGSSATTTLYLNGWRVPAVVQLSSTAMQFFAPAGAGANLAVRVVVAGQTAVAPTTLSYGAPYIVGLQALAGATQQRRSCVCACSVPPLHYVVVLRDCFAVVCVVDWVFVCCRGVGGTGSTTTVKQLSIVGANFGRQCSGCSGQPSTCPKIACTASNTLCGAAGHIDPPSVTITASDGTGAVPCTNVCVVGITAYQSSIRCTAAYVAHARVVS